MDSASQISSPSSYRIAIIMAMAWPTKKDRGTTAPEAGEFARSLAKGSTQKGQGGITSALLSICVCGRGFWRSCLVVYRPI